MCFHSCRFHKIIHAYEVEYDLVQIQCNSQCFNFQTVEKRIMIQIYINLEKYDSWF